MKYKWCININKRIREEVQTDGDVSQIQTKLTSVCVPVSEEQKPAGFDPELAAFSHYKVTEVHSKHSST